MTPSQQRPMFITLLIASVAIVVYLFCVEPARQTLAKTNQQRETLETQRQAMLNDLKAAPQMKNNLASIEVGRRPYLDALLVPFLESYAMGAKSILKPIAADSCLNIIDYEEMEPRSLPLTKPLSAPQLYARKPIRVKCVGTYAEIVSFIMRVEKTLPLVSLQSFSLRVRNASDEQDATIVFEWPVKGVNTAAAKGV